jgi:hypothetical protein
VIWLPALVPLAALVLKEVLNYRERKMYTEERARLIAAALATTPAAAAEAVRPARKRNEERPRPMLPDGL